MAVPQDWLITYTFNNAGGFAHPNDARGICPHCRMATTFQIRAFQHDAAGALTRVYLILLCNYAPCRKTVYVATSIRTNAGQQLSGPDDEFFMHPSRAVDPAHPSVPADIAEDWLEAQRSMQAANPKSAAVMLRRVLYGVLMDKGCKLHPLREGMEALIVGQRLPAVFDNWLPAIRDDGHDGAHPDRALKVSPENVTETMEYTAELLRYLYIEPYEFQQRQARNAAIAARP